MHLQHNPIANQPDPSDSIVDSEIKRLKEALDARNRELEVYQLVQQAINRQLEPGTVLQMIADYARQLTHTSLATVYMVDQADLRLTVISGELDKKIPIGYRIPIHQSVAGRSLLEQKPYCILNARSDPRVYQDAVRRSNINSFLIVPLVLAGRSLGVISVTNKIEGELNEEDERILTLLAANVVISLENARLYANSAETATLAERSRLARELHDAVTQSLFSASLIGDVLPRLWQEDPAEGQRRLEELRRLTRGALAEMRTLLLELRPTALEEAKLQDLLRHLANAFTGRTQIPVQLVTNTEISLPPGEKIAFYRIAQEALNNINKYAEAENVLIRLDHHNSTPDQDEIILEILDDGQGFDPEKIPTGHFGLQILRERAESISARLSINSAPGEGTSILVGWTPPSS